MKLLQCVIKYRMRIAASLLCAVTLFTVPQWTEARYFRMLNGFMTVSAGASYFGSNYMSSVENFDQQGATITIYDWNGKVNPFALGTSDNGGTGGMQLWVQNYENALLANRKGEDLYYKIDFWVTSNRTDVNCGINISSVENGGTVSYTDDAHTRGTITGSIFGDSAMHVSNDSIGQAGIPKEDKYSMELTNYKDENETPKLQGGDWVRVTFKAQSRAQEYQFARKLKGTFTFFVLRDEDYAICNIENIDGNQTIRATMKARNASATESANKTVYLWWNTEKLSVNTRDYTFGNYYFNGCVEKRPINGVDYFVVKLADLAANDHRTFEFRNLTGSDLNISQDTPLYNQVGAGTYPLGFYVETRGSGSAE